MRISAILILIFTTFSFSQNYAPNYYNSRHGGAIGGFTMRLVGTGFQYGVALPMLLNSDGSNVGGAVAMDLMGGGLAMAGDITAGVAATRAYKTAREQRLPYSGPDASWGLFGAGIGVAVVGGIMNTATQGESPIGLVAAITSDVLLTAHCIKSVAVTKNAKEAFERRDKAISFGIVPVITKEGAGLNIAVVF